MTNPARELLVFDHVGEPRSGTQVPAGGIKPGERPASAVLRELAEESGLTNARLIRKLGTTWRVAEPGNVPAGLEEQVHHAFHLHLDEIPEVDTWEWDECSDGAAPLHRFALRWVDLEAAASMLWPIQAMWIAPLRSSIEHM